MIRRKIWLRGSMALLLCAAMATGSVAVYAEETEDCVTVWETDFDNSEEQGEDQGDTADFTEGETEKNEDVEEAEIAIEESEEQENVSAAETDAEETDFSDDTVDSETTLGGKCGTDLTWKLQDGIMTISGSGAMDDFEHVTSGGKSIITPWEEHKAEIKELYIKDGVTVITRCAFSNCENLEKVVWGNSIKRIEQSAFAVCGFSEITLPDSLTELGDEAFELCGLLQKITFGKGMKVIPFGCCRYDQALTSVEIPEGITTIEKEAFQECRSLREITLPSSVTEVKNEFGSDVHVTFLNKSLKRVEDGTFVNGIYVTLTAKEMYKKAFEVLSLTNKERARAGLSALVMDQSLLDTAMLRGFEIAINYSHERPNGSMCASASVELKGENIAMDQITADEVVNDWMGSPGHRANLLSPRYKSIGIGCVYASGYYYWVQCFNTEAADSSANVKSYSDKNKKRTILVKKDEEHYFASLDVPENLTVGENAAIKVRVGGCVVNNTGIVFESSNPSVCEVENGKLSAKKPGVSYITMYYPEYKEAAVRNKITVRNKKSETNAGTTCKVTYYLNGGQGKTITRNIKKNAKLGTLPSAKRTGYVLAGWYTSTKNGTKVTEATKVTKNLKLYARWSKVKVGKTSVKKLTNTKGRSISVLINKVSGAKGYQIVYANNAGFKGAKNITTTKTLATLKNLQKNKTYYVKVRAYKGDSAGKKVFGAYSGVKKIKIKK